MVVQEENEGSPVELAINKQPLYGSSKDILMINHIQKMAKACPTCGNLKDSEEALRRDFEEMKELYLKCKSAMKHFEMKYGSILIHDKDYCRKRSASPDSDVKKECDCPVNKRIVFDDDGNEVQIDSSPENHICHKKQKLEESVTNCYEINDQVQIEDNNDSVLDLPDDLITLGNILKDPNLSVVNRYKVLDKVRAMRQEYTNEIKFNKQVLIEKLKTNPDEVLGFIGTNLSSIPGYS